MGGRSKITIDWERVNELLNAQCDGTGIASILGIHPDTLYRKCQEEQNICFADYSAQKKGEGKELLKERMWKEAIGGDKTMLIWLSKQYLGMSEKVEQKHIDDRYKDWTDEELEYFARTGIEPIRIVSQS